MRQGGGISEKNQTSEQESAIYGAWGRKCGTGQDRQRKTWAANDLERGSIPVKGGMLHGSLKRISIWKWPGVGNWKIMERYVERRQESDSLILLYFSPFSLPTPSLLSSLSSFPPSFLSSSFLPSLHPTFHVKYGFM